NTRPPKQTVINPRSRNPGLHPFKNRPRLKPNPMHRNAKFFEETNKSFRLARDLRLLHDLASPIHNANAGEFQRDVDSDIVLHGCPPSQMPGADSTVVTPFHHLSGDSHLHLSFGVGPITASSHACPPASGDTTFSVSRSTPSRSAPCLMCALG